MKRFPLVTLLLALPALLLSGDAAGQAWQYDREATGLDFILRLLTCQWTHWSAEHLFWDAMVFVVLGVVCEREGRLRLIATLAAAAVLIPLLVHGFHPDLLWFRGLSGVDSALFGLLLAGRLQHAIRSRNRGEFILIATALLAFLVKSLLEIATGRPVFFGDETFTVVPMAHLAGFAIGHCISLCIGVTTTASRESRNVPKMTRMFAKKPPGGIKKGLLPRAASLDSTVFRP